jgi:hypothetical protein
MRKPVLALALLAASSVVVGASAQPPTTSDEHARAAFEVGVQAYATGDYESAIQAFEEARRHSDRPGLLFSIAQAHRRAYEAAGGRAHFELAVDYYRKYLTRVPRGGRSAEAEQAIVKLEARARPAGRDDRAAAEAERLGRLMIWSPTPGATLSIDGELTPHLPYVGPLVPGPHKIAIRADGFAPDERVIESSAGQAVALTVELKELPATLLVGGTTGGEVLLDGRPVGWIPVQPIRTRAGWHRVSLRKQGYRIASQDVLLRHGASEQVYLRLTTTARRDLAWTLMGGAIASVAAGAGLGIYALSQQNRALALEEKRNAAGNSVSENDEFLAARSRRDTAGTAGAITGAAGLALGLAGLALYLFDTPEQLAPNPRWNEPAPARPAPPIDLAWTFPASGDARVDLRFAF